MKKFQRLLRPSHKKSQQKNIYKLEQELEYYKSLLADEREHNAELQMSNRCMSAALRVFGDPGHWKKEYGHGGRLYWEEFSLGDFEDSYNQSDHLWTPINFAREMNQGFCPENLICIECGRESSKVDYDELGSGPFCPECENIDLWKE